MMVVEGLRLVGLIGWFVSGTSRAGECCTRYVDVLLVCVLRSD
jgi:hypothetical protein